jgi:hypothetical protein
MANPYYTPTGNPGTTAPGASAPMRGEFTSIQSGFNLLPNFVGNPNTFVVVNSSGTGLTVIAGLAFTMNAFTVTMVANASVTLQLPAVNGTLALTSQITSLIARVQVFTASGTYTPSANMLYCTIECIGPGGGGGGAFSNAGNYSGGGGGGAGSYSRKTVNAATIGASKAVVVGAGGAGGTGSGNGSAGSSDTTLGATICVGKAGSGGTGTAASGSGAPGAAGGVAGTGDIAAPGQNGQPGWGGGALNIAAVGGAGGSTWLGSGGQMNITGTNTTGPAGTGYGGGGAGGASFNGSGNSTGGVGAPGLLVVTDFCSA